MFDEEALVKKKTQNWRRLAELGAKAEVSFRKLDGEEVVEFVRLYRQASADLAYFTTHSSNPELVEHLNLLVSRSYGQLYRSPIKPASQVFWNTLSLAARTVRAKALFVFLGIAIFLGSAALAGTIYATRPDVERHLLNPMMRENMQSWREGQHPERTGIEGAGATGFYMSNNPMAAIQTAAIAAGTFGVGTFYSMMVNGAILGVLAVAVSEVGHLDFLLISIAPHGVTEMGGFFMSAAAGLLLGWALIAPGRKSRAQSLREAGKSALVLTGLAVTMMFIAAPIEGFFSFNPNVPDVAKVGLASISLVGWLAFFLGYGREESEELSENARREERRGVAKQALRAPRLEG